MVIIVAARFVHRMDEAFRVVRVELVEPYYSPHACALRRVEIYLYGVFAVLEHVVGASADYYAGFARSDLLYRVGLLFEKLVRLAE